MLKVSQFDMLRAKANSLPTKADSVPWKSLTLAWCHFLFFLLGHWVTLQKKGLQLRSKLAFMLILAQCCCCHYVNEYVFNLNKMKWNAALKEKWYVYSGGIFHLFVISTRSNAWRRDGSTLWCRSGGTAGTRSGRRRCVRRLSVFFSPLTMRGRWRSSSRSGGTTNQKQKISEIIH